MRIGVWETSDRNGDRFVRSFGQAFDWGRWAEIQSFDRIPRSYRVVLLGASVARGLYYDPAYTPAKALELCMAEVLQDEVEVIDLACYGIRPRQLINVARASVELSADAVVVFAGNNWYSDIVPDSSLANGSPTDGGGVKAVIQHRESRLRERARSIVRDICEAFSRHVVFVVPESNLRDWHAEFIVPYLDGVHEQKWLHLSEELMDHLDKREWLRAIELADSLLKLDGGLSDLAYRCLAEYAMRTDDLEDALFNYRRARDVALWRRVGYAMLPSAGADAVASAAVEQGAAVVDLRKVLPELSVSGVPDRSVLLDSAHLTSKAITRVAAEASAILASHRGLSVSANEIKADLAEPAPSIAAGAHLCAAIANARAGQSPEVVRYHVETALARWEPIAKVMETMCDTSLPTLPWWMKPELSAPRNIQRFLSSALTVERLDALLITELRRALGDSEEMSVGLADRSLEPGVRTDLLSAFFAPHRAPIDWVGLVEASATTNTVSTAKRHYLRAHSPTSEFVFLLRSHEPVELELTARLGTPGICNAVMTVNGVDVRNVELEDKWRTWRIEIGEALTRLGINRVLVRWRRSKLATSPIVLGGLDSEDSCDELGVILAEVYSLYATQSQS